MSTRESTETPGGGRAPSGAFPETSREPAGPVPVQLAPEVLTHLIVVDDDEAVRRVCEAYLGEAAELRRESREVEIHAVATGEEAVALAARISEEGGRVSCAIVDVVLPGGMDGVETVLQLWEIDPAMHCTTMTGAGGPIERSIEGRVPDERLDHWDYMAKPFTRFEIVQRTRRALSGWYAHRRDELRSDENLRLMMRLARFNRRLEERVRERTRELAQRSEEQERKNVELQGALRALERAQGQLFHQEKLASIGQLAAGVAHELNNPIGFVHSNLGTLKRYSERIARMVEAYRTRIGEGDAELTALETELKIGFILEDLASLVDESLEGTERVRKIVTDLRGFSRPADQEPRYADINEALRSTLNIVHNEIKYKAQVITEAGEIPQVRCQVGHINQVFMNLLVNAAHAIEESGEIRIVTRAEDPFVVVSIRDTGCGIPPDVLPRIFDPFFTTKEVGRGTGLGLSISYDIVHKHGGTIEVESEVGKGTTFTIRLPVAGSEELDR